MRWERGSYYRFYLRLWPDPLLIIRGRWSFGVSSYSPTISIVPRQSVAYARQRQLCVGPWRIGLWWKPLDARFITEALQRSLDENGPAA